MIWFMDMLMNVLSPEMRQYDPIVRKRALEQVKVVLIRRKCVVIGFIVYVVLMFGVLLYLRTITRDIGMWIVIAIGFMTITHIAYILMYHKIILTEMRKYIDEHSTSICIQCGYNMSRASQNRCPECGSVKEDHDIPGKMQGRESQIGDDKGSGV